MWYFFPSEGGELILWCPEVVLYIIQPEDGHLLTAGGGRSRDKWVIIQGDSGRLCLVSQDNVLYRQALYLPDKIGALDGGSGCRISILRNANVACLCRYISPVPCRIQEMPMSHVTLLFEPMSLSLL